MTDEIIKADDAAGDLLPAVPQSAGNLNLLNKEATELLWKTAQRFANSGIVPTIFRGKPDDCFIALQMAARMKADPMMLMSAAYIVHGKLGFESKLATGLINQSGLMLGRMKFRTRGEDPKAEDYACQAYGTDRETGEDVSGEWITWALVRGEGWDSKTGSKWLTMPGQMFHYRASIFFIRRHYPEVLLGMQTTDELQDIAQADIISVTGAPAPKARADELQARILDAHTEGEKGDIGERISEKGDEAVEKLREDEPDDLETLFTKLGATGVEIDRFMHMKTGKVAGPSMTPEDLEGCVKLLGAFKTQKEFRDWMHVQADVQASREAKAAEEKREAGKGKKENKRSGGLFN